MHMISHNFEKALNAETTDESYKDGMIMIYNQLIETLGKIGVEEIKALNNTFDPNYHEAVMHVEDENFGEKEIVEVFRKGYKIGKIVVVQYDQLRKRFVADGIIRGLDSGF